MKFQFIVYLLFLFLFLFLSVMHIFAQLVPAQMKLVLSKDSESDEQIKIDDNDEDD